MSADPYQASAGPEDPGSWNRYAYVGGDPVRYNDPIGLFRNDCTATRVGCSYEYPEGWAGAGFGGGPSGCAMTPWGTPNLALCFVPSGPVQGYTPPGSSEPGTLTQAVIRSALDPISSFVQHWWTDDHGGLFISFGSSLPINTFLPVVLAGGGILIETAGGAAATTWVINVLGAATLGVVVNQIVQAFSQSQAGQQQSYDRAMEKYKQLCGKSLSKEERRRFHDHITGQGFSSDELVEELIAMFGCPKLDGGN